MSVDLKYDVVVLCVFVYGITIRVGRSHGLNVVLVGGTTCCNPT